MERGRKKGIQRENLEVQKIYSQSFKSLARKGNEKRDKTRESQGVGIRSISLRLSKISLTLQRNICQNMHTLDITLSPTKSSSPNYLRRQCPSKATWTWVPNPTSLVQKSVRIGVSILVADSFSWNSFTYMYMY